MDFNAYLILWMCAFIWQSCTSFRYNILVSFIQNSTVLIENILETKLTF